MSSPKNSAARLCDPEKNVREHGSRSTRLPLLYLVAREMRLHQWLKNVLVFIPLIASHQLTDLALCLKSTTAFLAFGLVASSVYVLNDFIDLQSDRNHPRKRFRPFASRELPLYWAFILTPLSLFSGLWLVSWFLAPAVKVIVAYYCLTCLYTFWLKGKMLADVFALSALYTSRVVMGAAACHIELSVWLLSFSMFLFVSLGFAKRSAELYNIGRIGVTLPNGRAYSLTDLANVNMLGVSTGCASSLVLTLYMNSENIRALYHRPKLLWLLFPLTLYWISRIWVLTSRGEMNEDPVLFAVRDRTTYLVLLACGSVMYLASSQSLLFAS